MWCVSRLLLLAAAAAAAVTATTSTCIGTFYPYPSTSHEDHNDDHDGYQLTIRILAPLPGVTLCTAAQAFNAFLYHMTSLDDIIIFNAFFDANSNQWILSETWRTPAGSVTSFNYALSQVNIFNYVTQQTMFSGIIDDFLELEEIHSAVELGLYHSVRVSSLRNPTKYNVTTMAPLINSGLLPLFANLGYPVSGLGGVDYTSTYPTFPFPNTFWLTETTYFNESAQTYGENYLQPWITTNLGPALLDDAFYQGQVQVFWHSAPGTTAALPSGVSAPQAPTGYGNACPNSAFSIAPTAAVMVAVAVLAATLKL